MSWWRKKTSNLKRAVAAFLGLQQTPDGTRVSTEDMKAADQIFSSLDTESQHQVELVIDHLNTLQQNLVKKAMKNEKLNEAVLNHLEETDRKATALIQRFQGVSLVDLRGQTSSESLKSEFTFDQNFQGMTAQDYAQLQASMNNISSNIKKHFEEADVILRSSAQGLPKDAEEILEEIHGLYDKFRAHAGAWSTHAGKISAPLQDFINSSKNVNKILQKLKKEAIELNSLTEQIGNAVGEGRIKQSDHIHQAEKANLLNSTIMEADKLFRECNKGIRHITQDLRTQLRYDRRESAYAKRTLGAFLTLGQRKVCRFSDEDKKKITANVSKQLDQGRAEIDRLLEDIKKKYLAELEQHDKCIHLRDWVNRKIRKNIQQCVDIENGVEALHKQLGNDLKQLERLYKDEEKIIHEIEKAEEKTEKDLVKEVERDQKKREKVGTTKDPIVQPVVNREVASLKAGASVREVIEHYEARIKPVLKDGGKLNASVAQAFRLTLLMREKIDISDSMKEKIFENYLDTWASSVMKTKKRDKESHRKWCTKPNKAQKRYQNEWQNYQRITLKGIRKRRTNLIERYTKSNGYIHNFQLGKDITNWYCEPIQKTPFGAFDPLY